MLPPGTYKRGHRMKLPSEAAPIADAGRGHGPEGCGVIFTIQAGRTALLRTVRRQKTPPGRAPGGNRMTNEKIARINELARKSRAQGLTEQERAEQAALRREYIDAMKRSLKVQLDSTVLVEPDGTRRPLKK